jgi:hypothetical protein
VVEFRQRAGGGAAITPDNPIPDNPNWRRFRHACPYYRERWGVEGEVGVDGRPLLYQIICLQNTPPLDDKEQDRCLRTRATCWRLAGAKRERAPAASASAKAEAAEVPC